MQFRSFFARATHILLVVFLQLTIANFAVAADKPLTNADVIAMSKADLGDEIIVAKIQQSPSETLDVSTQALIELKKNNVSKPVIAAIVKRAGKPAGTITQAASTGSSAPSSVSSLPAAKPRKAGDVSKGQPCVANFTTEGGFWKGEGKLSFQDFPGVEASDKLFERISQSVASGGWQITSTSKETGTVSGFQEIKQIMSGNISRATLNILMSRLETGGLRLEATLMVPAGAKVTDKDAQKVFCRIFDSVNN